MRYLGLGDSDRAHMLKTIGVDVLTETFFNEFVVCLPVAAAPVVERLARQDVFAGIPLARLSPGMPGVENLLLVAATEMVRDADIDRLCDTLSMEVAR